MLREIINIRTKLITHQEKKNDTQGNNHDSSLKKKARNEPRQKK